MAHADPLQARPSVVAPHVFLHEHPAHPPTRHTRPGPHLTPPQDLITRVRQNNVPPIPKSRVKGFPDRNTSDAWLLAHPDTALGGVHFSRDPRGNLQYILQVGAAAGAAGAAGEKGRLGRLGRWGRLGRLGPGAWNGVRVLPTPLRAMTWRWAAVRAGREVGAARHGCWALPGRAAGGSARHGARGGAALQALPHTRPCPCTAPKTVPAPQSNSTVKYFKGDFQDPTTFFQV
jgi:hypothetical protein